MEQAFSDTDPETARVHLDLLRASSPERRLRLAFSLSHTTMSLCMGGLARSLPGASSQDVALRFVALLYGAQLAEEVREHLAARTP